MTMHKAKGLEFDTVILPSLHRLSRSQDPEILRWQEHLAEDGQAHLLMAGITVSGKEKKDPIYQYLVEQDKKKERHQNCRLLYVACTRARKHLHLLTAVKYNKKDESSLDAPAKTSLLATVWQALQTQIKVHDLAEMANITQDREDKPRAIKRLSSDWMLPALGEGHLLDQYIPYYEHDNDSNRPEFQGLATTPQHVGTLIHRILQEMGEHGLKHWSLQRIQQSKLLWRTQLMNLGVVKDELETALNYVVSAVEKIWQDDNIRWMLSEDHVSSKQEYAVTIKTTTGFSHLVIDLLIEDGKIRGLLTIRRVSLQKVKHLVAL